jgi:acyl-CoA thioester hydrolase
VALIPSVAEVTQLPSSHTHVVTQDWADGNGHVNMARYLSLHDQALWPYNAGLGMDARYRDVDRRGLFTLEQHLTYHAEVLVGDAVTVHCRLLERTSKLIRGISFVLNTTRGELANTMEFVTANVDLDQRRVIEFSDDIAANLDRELEAHRSLGWTASISRGLSLDGDTSARQRRPNESREPRP